MNEKWFLLSIAEIEKKLKTNAASGLSRKAARSRCSNKYGAVFSVPVRSPLSYLGELMGDFAYVMLLIMSFLAICFSENETGIVSAVCIVINLVAAYVTYYKSQYFNDSLERLFLPRARVVREGRLYFVNGAKVVRGDIIMLEAGDIVPADARLITSENLKVKMLYEREKFVLLDKAAEGRVFENEKDPAKFSNVVHAASVVVSGSARAVVTEVGQYTYVGARIGNIPSSSKGRYRAPKLLSVFKKYSMKLSFILMATVFPFSVLSMLFGNTTLSLFTAFMTAISIAACCTAQFSVTLGKVFYTTSMKRCITSAAPSLIRSADAMDKLASSNFVFVLDGAMLSDGVLHFDKLLCADGELSCDDKPTNATVKRFGELAALYEKAQKNSLSLSSYNFYRYELPIREFSQYAGADEGALNIRCNITGFAAASKDLSDPHDKLFYTEFGEKYMLSVSYTDSIINECKECLKNGQSVPLCADARQVLMNSYRTYLNSGKRVVVFSLCKFDGFVQKGERCFIGMLVLSQRVDPSAAEALSQIRSMGVTPIFFRNVSVGARTLEVSAIPSELTDAPVFASDFARRGLPVTHELGKISCYDSMSDVQICEMIDALHLANERVCVVGFCEEYERVYAKADVVISCSSDEYRVSGKFEEQIDIMQTPDDLSKIQVAETLRRRVDMVLPRPDKESSGGCASLLSAIRFSRGAIASAARFFRYLVCMQITRAVLVMVPMLFGSVALDSRHVIIGGFVADLIVMFTYVFENSAKRAKTSYRLAIGELSSPLRYNFSAIVSFAGAALLASVLPELVSVFPGVPKYIDKTEYSFVVFVLLHLAVFVCMKNESSFKNIGKTKNALLKKESVIGLCYIILMLLFMIFSFVLPKLSNLFDIEGFSNLL